MVSNRKQMKLSLCLTTFNRYNLTVKAIDQVLEDPRIGDVVILDDASTDGSYDALDIYYSGDDKVRVIKQLSNRGMSRNKADAIGYAYNPFAIIFDSDNTISPEYLNAMEGMHLDNYTIYLPEFARNNFDYREFSGLTFDKRNIKDYLDRPLFEALLNTANYIVPVKEYCRVYKEDTTVMESDTVHFAYLWLLAGNQFHVVDGLQYDHLVHSESCWLKNAAYNSARGKKTIEQIRAL